MEEISVMVEGNSLTGQHEKQEFNPKTQQESQIHITLYLTLFYTLGCLKE